MLFVVDGTPYRADWMTVEESCLGDDGLEANFLPFSIEKQGDDLGGECGDVIRSDLVSIDPRSSTPGGSWRWISEQCGIFAHLADELALAVDQGQ